MRAYESLECPKILVEASESAKSMLGLPRTPCEDSRATSWERRAGLRWPLQALCWPPLTASIAAPYRGGAYRGPQRKKCHKIYDFLEKP